MGLPNGSLRLELGDVGVNPSTEYVEGYLKGRGSTEGVCPAGDTGGIHRSPLVGGY